MTREKQEIDVQRGVAWITDTERIREEVFRHRWMDVNDKRVETLLSASSVQKEAMQVALGGKFSQHAGSSQDGR